MSVQLSEVPHILAGRDLGSEIESFLNKLNYNKLFILVDSNTHKACLPHLVGSCERLRDAEILEVEPGEESKSPEIAQGLWQTLLEQGASRSSILMNVGGGVVCDLGGYVASTYMRGIRTIHVPTTLLAMVDASVGGKTGINFQGYKNIIGSFYHAEAVFADTLFLDSLPEDELKSGFAEVLKHALIDGESWESLPENITDSDDNYPNLVANSIRIKQRITDADFREHSLREVLNLGHTVAHALESLYFQKGEELKHGFAVAAGLVIESMIAEEENIGPESCLLAMIEGYVNRNYGRVDFSEADIPFLMESMGHDKKNRGAGATFSLLKKPGEVLTGIRPEAESIRKSLKRYLNAGNA